MVENRLEVKVLGKPELRWHGRLLEGIPHKLRALLFYLVMRGEPIVRNEIRELFWGPKSHLSLRQALYQLHSFPGADHWLSVGREVRVEALSDLASFETALKRKDYQQALLLCQDFSSIPPRSGLLWGFELERTPAFSDWLEVERARIEMLYMDTLEQQALILELRGRFDLALRLIEKLLQEDPLNEHAYQIAMRLSHGMNQPSLAHRYFERCKQTLFKELKTEPLAETVQVAYRPEAPKTQGSLRQALDQLPDPRSRQGQRYPLTPLLGLVLLAVLCGAHSLRDVVRFGHAHPDLLKQIGFHRLSPPGRSTLAELLGHLDLQSLWEILSRITPLPHQNIPGKQTALALFENWAFEVRQHTDSSKIGWLNGLLEYFGWTGLVGWICFGWQNWPGLYWPGLFST